MSKHTPGPWEIAPRIGRYQVVPATEQERYRLAKINALEFGALSVGVGLGQVAIIPLDESNRANANLIAAAPDLFEALADIFKIGDVFISSIESKGYGEDFEQWADKARAAIARATGEQS